MVPASRPMRFWIALAVLVLAGAGAQARADGKAFHSAAPNLTMPDQRAIIVWKDGVQTLVISTAIDMPAAADGAKSAWVVPLPTAGKAPEVFPVDAGVFDAARAACTPRLARVPADLAATLFILAVISWTGVLLPARRTVTAAVASIVCAVVLVAAMLPALGKARAGGEPGVSDSAVRILDARRVGAFDTVTLSSSDPAELIRWLGDNSFSLPPGIERVVADYVAKRWVFVAVRLADDAAAGAGRVEPHPLGFRFATATPVYPLRLTGVGNGNLDVELFVFGPGTASTPDLSATRSGPVTTDAPPNPWLVDGVVRVTQPELAALSAGSAWLTRLSGVLTPRDMAYDAEISFGRGRDLGGLVYSDRGAQDLGEIVGAAALLALSIGAWAARGATGAGPWRRLGWLVGAGALSSTTGIAVAATREVVPVESRGIGAVWRARNLHELVATGLSDRLAGVTPSLDAARTAARILHEEHAVGSAHAHREGVGPRQWRILPPVDSGGAWMYEYRDAYGAPQRIAVTWGG